MHARRGQLTGELAADVRERPGDKIPTIGVGSRRDAKLHAGTVDRHGRIARPMAALPAVAAAEPATETTRIFSA